MSVVTREKFLKAISKSGILNETTLEEWMAEISPDADSKDLARDLASKKLLTRWQAKMLLKGAWRLRFGNYLLTDRIDRTEFGDLFAATHRQLSRDVRIQYLPTEFCDSSESRKKLFSLGSKLSELDHPNLVHVYDVDEERERVYLVSEVAKGKTLPELLADSPSQSCAAVARIIRGCLKGVSYAHSKNVIHGNIAKESVVVRPDGEPKICGLTQFAVRNELAETPAAASNDIDSVTSIAKTLLTSVVKDEQETESFWKLKAAVASVANDPAEAISLFDQLVQTESDSSLDSSDISLAPAAPRPPVTAHPAAAIAQPIGYAAGEDVPEATELTSEGFLSSLAKRNPAALVACSALAALLLIGGTVFAASKLLAPPAAVADAGVDSPEKASADSRASGKKNSRKNKAAAKVERPNFRDQKGALSKDAPVAAPASATDPSANLAALDAIFSKGDDAKPVAKKPPVEVVTTKVAKTRPPEKVAAATPEPTTPAPTPVAVAKKDAKPAETKTKPVVATPPAKSASKAAPAKKQPQEQIAAGTDPFKNYATMVDLPDIAGTEQVSFGKLILEKRHLLGVEILSTPVAHRSKPVFELARSSDDKQTWDISFKKKRRSPPVVVAKLQKTPNELKFNWLPEAAELSSANYLRNCRLKLSTAIHSHWLTLRRPVKIEGFALGKTAGQVKVDYEIPFMPNPVALAASANGIKFERMDKEDYKQKSHLEPAEITPNAPARMYFHMDKDRFLSLDVGIAIRKKVTLKAALVIQPSPDQPGTVLENPAGITQVGMQVRQLAQQAKAVAQQAKQALNQKKIKEPEEKAYAAAAKKAADQAEHTGYYEHVVPQLLEKEIPVIITYALNDQHRIILAYTAETAETKKK